MKAREDVDEAVKPAVLRRVRVELVFWPGCSVWPIPSIPASTARHFRSLLSICRKNPPRNGTFVVFSTGTASFNLYKAALEQREEKAR